MTEKQKKEREAKRTTPDIEKEEKRLVTAGNKVRGTPWKKGGSGNPYGKGKRPLFMSEALREVMEAKSVRLHLYKEVDGVGTHKDLNLRVDRNFYHAAAVAVALKAAEGDLGAIQYITDRLEGKAKIVEAIEEEHSRKEIDEAKKMLEKSIEALNKKSGKSKFGD